MCACQFISCITDLSARDSTGIVKHASILAFSYLKKTDGTKVLSLTASCVINRRIFPLINAPVVYYCGENELAVIQTNDEGKVLLLIDPGYKPPVIADGSSEYKAVYKGSDTIEGTESSINVTDIRLKLKFTETDSTRAVGVKAYQLSPKGDTIPVKDVGINFAVKRMFSNLKIGEGTTDETGYCSSEFPADIPGDSIGHILILARIEESDLYANVEIGEIKMWGIPTNPSSPLVQRELWTEIAPVWMIVTLIILLTGVWAHYSYAAFNIYRIRKEGKEIERLTR
jgi:hypothetical protein